MAGSFYPGDSDVLQTMVRSLLDAAALPGDDRPIPKALIVPHAGYVFSGSVAATAYRLLESVRERIRRVVLLGPSHRVYLTGMAFPTVDAFVTPLGEVPLDRAAIDRALRIAETRLLDEAHALEHSLEVQLPFLQSVLAEFELVPFVVGRCGPAAVGEVLETLWGGAETLIVVSSDLSHFLPYAAAVARDEQTSAALVARSDEVVGEEACGAYALNGLMRAVRGRGLRVRMLDLRNSGDTAGDHRRVVGYGAYAIG